GGIDEIGPRRGLAPQVDPDLDVRHRGWASEARPTPAACQVAGNPAILGRARRAAMRDQPGSVERSPSIGIRSSALSMASSASIARAFHRAPDALSPPTNAARAIAS